MGSDIAFPGSFTTSCKLRSFASSSVLRLSRLAPKPRHRTRPSDWPTFASKELVCCDYDVMSRLPRFLKPLTAGLTVTLLQLAMTLRSEEHTSELQSHSDLVCRLLLEKKKKKRARRTRN